MSTYPYHRNVSHFVAQRTSIAACIAIWAICCSFFFPNTSSAQTWKWARGSFVYETTAYQGISESMASACNSQGDVYQIVRFAGDSISFASTTIVPPDTTGGLYHGALVKYDSSGNMLWVKYIAHVGILDHVTVDKADNIYVTGRFETDTLYLPGIDLPRIGAIQDYFVIKYDPSGNIIWAINNGRTWSGVDVKTDEQCNVYLAGDIRDTVHYGSTTLVSGPFGNDIMLLKYDSSGAFLWGRQMGAGHARALSLCLDAEKNIFISGYYGAPFTFAGLPYPTSGYFDNLLLKYDSTGTPVWCRTVLDHDIYPSMVCADAAGNAYVISSFSHYGLVIGTYTLVSAPSIDYYVVKYNKYGAVVWAKRGGGYDLDYGRGIMCDPSSNLWITGGARSTSFSSGTMTATFDISTNGSAWVARLDTNGNTTFLTGFRNGTYNIGNAPSGDAFGNVYVAGCYMNGNCIIGPDTLQTVTVPVPSYPVMLHEYLGKLGNGTMVPCSLPDILGTFSLCSGAATTLTSAFPGGTWQSSTLTTGTINSTTGVVIGGAPGTTIITYRTSPTCFRTQTVTVNPLPNAGTIVGTDSVCLAASVTLSDAVPWGIWSSSNPAIGSVSSTGIVTGMAGGTTIIRYAVLNSCGSDTATLSFTVLPLLSAGTLAGSATVCQGSTATISASTPGGTWSSSSPGVGTVSSAGVVTGVSPGSTTITYTVSNICGTDFTTSFLTVLPLPSAGSLVSSSTVCQGDSINIWASVGGGTWSSSNTNVSVSSIGNATGMSVGSATISYIVSNTCGADTATISLSVTPLPSAGSLSGISTICLGDSISITPSVTGGIWSSSNANAAVSSSGKVKGMISGTATISYTVSNSCGSAVTTMNVSVQPCKLSIHELYTENDIILFPDPSTGSFTLAGDGIVNATIVVTTMSGQEIKATVDHRNKDIYVSLPDVASGLYMVKIILNGDVHSKLISIVK